MRGQIWSFDYAVSLFIFVSVLILILFYWSYASTETVTQIQLEQIEDRALTASDLLIRSQGVPSNWTTSTVLSIGLAGEEKILNRTKLLAFEQLNYNTSKVVLGVGSYDFFFQLLHANGTVVSINGTAMTVGLSPTNASIIVPVERHVLYEGEIVTTQFQLWAR